MNVSFDMVNTLAKPLSPQKKPILLEILLAPLRENFQYRLFSSITLIQWYLICFRISSCLIA